MCRARSWCGELNGPPKLDCYQIVVFKLWSLHQHDMGTCWKYTFLCPNPDLLNQKLQGVSPENCVLTSPPGDTGVWLKFENSGLNYVAS